MTFDPSKTLVPTVTMVAVKHLKRREEKILIESRKETKKLSYLSYFYATTDGFSDGLESDSIICIPLCLIIMMLNLQGDFTKTHYILFLYSFNCVIIFSSF